LPRDLLGVVMAERLAAGGDRGPQVRRTSRGAVGCEIRCRLPSTPHTIRCSTHTSMSSDPISTSSRARRRAQDVPDHNDLIEYRERAPSARRASELRDVAAPERNPWQLANTDSLIPSLLHRLRASSREILSGSLERTAG
jgi:hypothetical protein